MAMPKLPGMATVLGRGLPAAAPGYALILQRVVYQPGDVVPPHVHPGAEVFYVDAGTFGLTILKGDAYVTRGVGAAPAAG
jgi:quercetin dioxygenase-like cupin family protein